MITSHFWELITNNGVSYFFDSIRNNGKLIILFEKMYRIYNSP